MDRADKNPKRKRLICLCNAISQDVVEAAVERGCNTLGKIFDATTAGVGACGGSCQPILRKMLETYNQTGVFPEDPRTNLRKRRRRIPPGGGDGSGEDGSSEGSTPP